MIPHEYPHKKADFDNFKMLKSQRLRSPSPWSLSAECWETRHVFSSPGLTLALHFLGRERFSICKWIIPIRFGSWVKELGIWTATIEISSSTCPSKKKYQVNGVPLRTQFSESDSLFKFKFKSETVSNNLGCKMSCTDHIDPTSDSSEALRESLLQKGVHSEPLD